MPADSTFSTLGVPLIPHAVSPALNDTTCATVLHARLQGYAELVDILPPPEAAERLAQFFAMLIGVVLESGGQIFHVAEAEMMAGFGVGDSRHGHILDALTAARDIQRRFEPLRLAWREDRGLDAGVGIGLHRGEVAIGQFGPPGRGSQTLVGDPANVAAQLCRRARAGEVLLSAAVHPPREPADIQELMQIPPMKLEGRNAPLEVWCWSAAFRAQAAARSGEVPRH